MHWKLKVVEYGKIESAEIEVMPLTLFVGDNNSGKSYLMSLLWGIQNLGIQALLGTETNPETDAEKALFNWTKIQVDIALESGSNSIQISEITNQLQIVLQERLKKNKDKLVEMIFNSSDVKIKELQIELTDLEEVSLYFKTVEKENGRFFLLVSNLIKTEKLLYINGKKEEKLNDIFYWYVVKMIFCLLMDINFDHTTELDSKLYLPASRTGFMLTKDIINKISRRTAFNIKTEQEEITPFTKPINQFLDVINDLSLDDKGNPEFEKIIEYLENGMADGTIEMSTLPNKEVFYIPFGNKTGMSLRIVSAVVTELSPLILILKHKKMLDTLFYEEPEICLHPQLQQKMAKIICQLVNSQLNMVVTTHSDIILQHINNMIHLSNRKDVKEICNQLKYTDKDLLKPKEVKVYQLKVGFDGKTKVEELICGEYGFVIPTFNDALDKITEDAYIIQE